MSTKGRVTVPVDVRRKLGLTAGSVVWFEVRGRTAIMSKARRGQHPVDSVYGSLKLERSTDEILDEMRGRRPSGAPISS